MKVKNQKEIKKNEFRRNKVNKHPAYIYAKVGNDYKYLGITHSEITKGSKNIKLEKNPNPNDKKTAYVRPQAEKEKVNKFSKKEQSWKFSKNDKVKISKYKK